MKQTWVGVVFCEGVWQNGNRCEAGHKVGNRGDDRRNVVPGVSGQTMSLWVWVGRVWRV